MGLASSQPARGRNRRNQRHRGRGAAGPAPMTRRTATVILRTSAIERCVTGLLLLGRTDAITGLIAGDQPRPPAWLVRVLGSRLLAQGLLEYTQPRRQVVLACGAVDAVHAASMDGVDRAAR